MLGSKPNDRGFQLSTTFDTVENINSNLFSISSLYEDHGFSLLLRHDTYQGGRCELRRTLKDGTTQSIPLSYDKSRSAFIIKFIMGKDKTELIRQGREIEYRRGLTLKENMSMGLRSSICPSTITKMGVILYTETNVRTITHDVPRHDLAYINRVTRSHEAKSYIPTRFDMAHQENAHMATTPPEGEINPRGVPIIEASQEQWNRHMFEETDAAILGAKSGMKIRERNMSQLELHTRHGHIGPSGGKCIICNLLKGSFSRIRSKTSPYIELRVGHTFCGDVITWSDRSRQGSKYTMVLRDICSGYFFLIHAIFRNEFTRKIEELVTSSRNNPIFGDLKRPIISCLKLDPAGEWRNDNKEFQAMAIRVGISIIYSSPDDKRSNAHAENSVKQIEITARSILLSRSLPTFFIEDAANQAADIRNYYPLARDCKSGDGDTRRPFERITCGGISRREIDTRLHHLIPLGTPCLIYQPKNKGSNLRIPKARWGIALSMDKSMPIFFCPFRGPGTQFRSKNYIEYTLGIGINYYKFLGLEEPTMPKISLPKLQDRNIDITTITQIDNLCDYIGETTYGPPPIEEVRDPSLATKPLVTLTDQHGWIYETDTHGDIQKSSKRIRTSEDQDDIANDVEDQLPTTIIEDELTPQSNPTPSTTVLDTKHEPPSTRNLIKNPSSFIGQTIWKTFDGFGPSEGTITEYHPREKLWSISYEDGDAEDFDIDEMTKHLICPEMMRHMGPRSKTSQRIEPEPTRDSIIETKIYSCKEGENFLNICDSIGLPLHHRKIYYKWLGDGYGQFGEEWDPSSPTRLGIYFNYPWNRGRKTIFRNGTSFPIPQDNKWHEMVQADKTRGEDNNPTHIVALATNNITKRIIMSEWLKDRFRNEGSNCTTSLQDITDKATGKIMAPKSLRQALNRPDSILWKEAIRKELNALDELGVLSHHHKMKDIRAQGIATSAVPMQLLYDVKYHPDGSLDKYKVREVVQGHKGYMRRGEHFFNTFSASPSCRTTRLLQAITIGTGLHRHAWDICTAYLWADVKDRERIPIRYPKDLRKYDDETGEELYAILKKNCYGMPQADRRYTQLRNKFINEEFNKGGWKCNKSKQDPCLSYSHPHRDLSHTSSSTRTIVMDMARN